MDIEYRPISYGEELKLAASIGSPDQSRQWWARARLYAGVRNIDGRRVHFPQTPAHIRGIVTRLGSAGVAQVAKLAEKSAATGAEPAPKLAVRAMDEMETLDFFERFGAVADVPAFAGLAFLACAVREIDGEPVEMPDSVAALSALVDRLGRAGIEGAAEALNATPEADAEAEASAAKN